jgi:hypothetical protein
VPIKSKKELEHKAIPRGTTDILYRKDQVLVGWKDNKAVYMASNVHGAKMDRCCRRYNRVEKRDIQVPIPAMFQHYNARMGGVDLLDNLVSVYRVNYRMKKWWYPFYTWSLR